MKQSQLFTKTREEAPRDEESKNAQLLIRAGFIHKEMAGVYDLLPLGLRVVEKIKNIVREEMNALGGQEFIMSSLQAKDTWTDTKRWDDEVVDVWFKSKLNAGGEVGFGWSHEEPITKLMKNHISSYKDLPVYVYQFQNKLRNELRAKSGILRGREFIMKDMYSFSTDAEQHETFYQKTIDAYNRVFDRLGIGDDTFVTFAAGGAFTEFSHEFQTITDAGEDEIYVDIQTKDVYNKEIAPSKIPHPNEKEEFLTREDCNLAGIIGVDALVESLKIPIEKTTKTLIFQADNRIIVAAVRGDYSINEFKLKKVAKCENLALATESQVKNLTGSEIGYAGIIDLPKNTEIYFDDSLDGLCNFETGSNNTGFHSININFGVDVEYPKSFFDIKEVKEGDINPNSGNLYKIYKTAEVGNIFNFGTQKCEEMDLYYKGEDGKSIPVFLGSYGIGITRLMGVIAEKMSDDKGLVWPESIAPFQVHLLTFGKNENVFREAENLYHDLKNAGIEVLFDDRDLGPGQKLNDADLIGIPYRIVVSEKAAENGGVEIKKRDGEEVEYIASDTVLAYIQNNQ